MKSLIKKVLLEHNEEKSREERIQEIIDKKKYVEKRIPKIIEYFKLKYGESLEKIELSEKKIFYGHERFSFEEIVMNFYFNDADNSVRYYLIKDLRDFFNIDITNYGVSLDFEVFRKKWEKV